MTMRKTQSRCSERAARKRRRRARERRRIGMKILKRNLVKSNERRRRPSPTKRKREVTCSST